MVRVKVERARRMKPGRCIGQASPRPPARFTLTFTFTLTQKVSPFQPHMPRRTAMNFT